MADDIITGEQIAALEDPNDHLGQFNRNYVETIGPEYEADVAKEHLKADGLKTAPLEKQEEPIAYPPTGNKIVNKDTHNTKYPDGFNSNFTDLANTIRVLARSMGAEAIAQVDCNLPYEKYIIKAKVKVEFHLNQQHVILLFDILVNERTIGPKIVEYVMLQKQAKQFSNLGKVINYLEHVLLK